MKLNRACWNLTVFFLNYSVVHYLNDLWNCFLIRFNSKTKDYSTEGKISFAEVHSVDVIGDWVHLAEKNSRPGAKINKIFRLS